ncbi:MAG: [FeFe] hydrogenase H-cluster maturation GTPase HydF [Chloroflexota bacterium]|nr:[FeFe] hydrogenase H-cluster maturation GTPase HydF [Lentimicrobium sp.]
MSKGRETKPHIGIFGRRNNGKSSIINVLAQNEVAIVSPQAGTTTDPVKKSMEIPGIGPVVLIDTAGIDDSGDLGQKRINKSLDAMKIIDLAILIIVSNTFEEEEEKLVKSFIDYNIPFLIIHNKSDITPLDKQFAQALEKKYGCSVLEYSAIGSPDHNELMKSLAAVMPETAYTSKALLGDLFNPGEAVLLITPIDNEAPEGRMILPQVQAIRDILDNDGIVMICKEDDVLGFIPKANPRPVLAVTDSQVFGKIGSHVPDDIPFTSFSILLARQRGDFKNYVKGTPHLANLKEGDRVLILESCTHHVTCDDIGRHKIPAWLKKYTGKNIEYDVVAGLGTLPRDIRDYAMVIQCGGCVLTKKQVVNRVKPAVDAGVPVTNYGMMIAWVHGIFDRAINMFKPEEVF